MAKVGPDTMLPASLQSPEKQKNAVHRKKSLSISTILMNNRTASLLNPEKFDILMASDFTSGFEESEACFSEITHKAALIINAEVCNLFLRDNKEQKLYTFVKDNDGNEVRVTKPLDRGITGSIILDPLGFNVHDVRKSRRWSHDLDELPDTTTKSYLAWPLHDSADDSSIGVVEFRNKISKGDGSFNAADAQMARIVAFQLGNAVVRYKQQTLLAGRDEAFKKVYERNCDNAETISITSQDENNEGESSHQSMSPIGVVRKRSAFTLAPSMHGVSFKMSDTLPFGDRSWDYDVLLQSDEQLMAHAIDVFEERGLFSRFSIPMNTFVNFINAIKAGYNMDSPYHNHYHAFDVMHVCYLLVTKCRADEYLESFNILSILVAALGHDLGHDGYNNAFHSATCSELAVTYNGVSILENYSAAYLFRILRKEENNIFARLSSEEMTKMRSRLIDLILDTDAKNHFVLMTRFKHGLEMKQLSRGLLSSMVLHVSDVSNPTRPGAISRKWAYAVEEEFFRQGDKEKELTIPRSPFMDREFEDLPKMQGAFIDALVFPVFKLLADFLPLVTENCIKPLQINRAFWNNMQNRGITTKKDILSYLDTHQKDDILSYNLKDDVDISSERSSPDAPIPGIPSNAPQTPGKESVRRMSLISLNSVAYDLVDPELGEGFDEPSTMTIRLRSPRRSLKETKAFCVKKMKMKMSIFLGSNLFQLTLFLATIYALFANDLHLAIGSKETDGTIDIVTFIVLLLFLVELIISIICVPKYMHFFFWLDLAASISLILEIDFLLTLGSAQGSPDQLSLAKASRAAKAGARAGRLAKILRLIRLIKVVKILKWLISFVKRRDEKKEDENDTDEDVELKMSVVGRKMTESITKKVIIAVLFMLLVFSLLDVNFTPDGRQLQLDAMARHPSSDILRQSFFEAHSNIIELKGLGDYFVNAQRIDELREVEKLSLEATSIPSIVAMFDVKNETSQTAWYSLGTTLIVTTLLGALSLLFSRDAYRIMIRPIEKMKKTVQQLSENPFLHLEKMKSRGASDDNETDMLEQAITKMAKLLQIGFGYAGSEIIAKSLSDGGELDPMVPGVKVNAIFGFCDIRDFTFATEGLQQDVMLFVNKVAEITHKHVVESGGAPNKNIGDAFLLVWKLATSKHGGRSNLQKGLFDASLTSIHKIIADIRGMGTLAAFLQEETDKSAAWRTSLEDFKVDMGFGLHTGWAIEGSIGSKVKIDASYLSPHVNLASRLESATKHYRVPLLMSDAFVAGLNGVFQSTCRRVDSVTFKGSNEPMKIFHYDSVPIEHQTDKPKNYAELLSATSWKDEAEINRVGVDVKEILSSLESGTSVSIRNIYDMAFNAYIDGQWGKCKVIFHIWLEKFPGDVVVHTLVEFLRKQGFVCPEGWQGYHALSEK